MSEQADVKRCLHCIMDNRRHKRFLVKEIKVVSEKRMSTEIQLADIGIGGACIKSPHRLKLNQDYLLAFETEDSQTDIVCTVVWEDYTDIVRDIEGGYTHSYLYGLQFKDFDQGEWEEIRGTLDGLFMSSEQRYSDERRVSGLRFKFYEEKTATLLYHEKYSVKKISYGGMLIESHRRIEPEQMHTMELLLPGDSHPIEFRGRIVSCKEIPGTEEERFEIGIEFLEMDDYERDRLVKFISELYLSKGSSNEDM